MHGAREEFFLFFFFFGGGRGQVARTHLENHKFYRQ